MQKRTQKRARTRSRGRFVYVLEEVDGIEKHQRDAALYHGSKRVVLFLETEK